MDLFKILRLTENDTLSGDKYKVITEKENIYSKPNDVDLVVEIIPTVQDTNGIMATVRSFLGKNDKNEVERLINSSLGAITISNRISTECVEYIQELIKVTNSSSKFAFSKDKISGNRFSSPYFKFTSLVPVLSSEVVRKILRGRDYAAVHNAINILIDTCINSSDLLKEKGHGRGFYVYLECVSEDLMVIRFSNITHNCFNAKNDVIADFNYLKGLKITEDHFDRYIDALNAFLKNTGKDYNDDDDGPSF